MEELFSSFMLVLVSVSISAGKKEASTEQKCPIFADVFLLDFFQFKRNVPLLTPLLAMAWARNAE